MFSSVVKDHIEVWYSKNDHTIFFLLFWFFFLNKLNSCQKKILLRWFPSSSLKNMENSIFSFKIYITKIIWLQKNVIILLQSVQNSCYGCCWESMLYVTTAELVHFFQVIISSLDKIENFQIIMFLIQKWLNIWCERNESICCCGEKKKAQSDNSWLILQSGSHQKIIAFNLPETGID